MTNLQRAVAGLMFSAIVSMCGVPRLQAQVEKKCNGNILVTALPPTRDLNGYKWVAIVCSRGSAEAIFEAGAHKVSVMVIDGKGDLGGQGDDSENIIAMAHEVHSKALESTKNLLDTIKQNIDHYKKTPEVVEALGGANYMPIVFSFAGENENYYIQVPPHDDANGYFNSAGVVRDRYVVAVKVEEALAGVDGPAARATIEPFLKTMSFSKLP
jgi:hypothetical protein